VRHEADAANAVSLHRFWDDLVTQADDSASVRANCTSPCQHLPRRRRRRPAAERRIPRGTVRDLG
jgi:hypothetical protein